MRPPRPIDIVWPLLLLGLTGAAADSGPARFTSEGLLERPADYREWVYLSTGIDMSYSEGAAAAGHSMFDNVFVDPAAWRAFKATGHWPDKAMFVLEVRGASSQGSINKRGQFQTGELMGLEVHLHDEARFKGGWGFFAFDGDKPAKQLPYQVPCYACHQAHGAVDTTFTQFYPTARPIAEKAGSFKAE